MKGLELLGRSQFDLGGVIRGLVESNNSNRVYEVSLDGAKAECQCEHATYNIPMDDATKWCRHALFLRNQVLEDSVLILQAKFQVTWEPEEGSRRLEEVASAVEFFRAEEFRIVSAALLLQARSEGSCCADDVHALVGHAVTGDGRIIGSAVSSLCRRGILRVAEEVVEWTLEAGGMVLKRGKGAVEGGVLQADIVVPDGVKGARLNIQVQKSGFQSARKETNHGREIKRFMLTKKGRDLVEEAILLKRPLPT